MRPRLHRVVIVLLSLCSAAPAGALEASPERTVDGLPALDEAADLVALARAADAWVARGQDDTEPILRRLSQAMSRPAAGVSVADWQRIIARSRGLVAARSGLLEEVRRAEAILDELAAQDAAPLAGADAALVRATSQEHQGEAEAAAASARVADARYSAVCSVASPPPACDHRPRWRTLRVLTLRADGQGNRVEALALAQREWDLAVAAGDSLLQSMSAATMAGLYQALGESTRATRQLAVAERAARRHGDNEAMVRVRLGEARVAQLRGDARASRRALEDALRLVQPLNSPRLAALINVNISDAWLHEGRADRALSAIAQALPVMRQHRDLSNQPVLLHNRGLARVQLGELARGRVDLEAALALWRQVGAYGYMEGALREYADALAATGDMHGALELFHRERDLRETLARDNRAALLGQLQARFGSQTERHELTLLERDNALKAARLDNQRLQQRVWAAAAVLLLAAMGVVVVLVKRTRDTNLRLRRSQALLKVQSECDPLTGLANRRHLREVLATQSTPDGFAGGLLLLDVDHFKRVNDEHGHSVGDQVLIEVARRLNAEARSGDLVCRWGGEEFLVYAPGLAGEGLEALAQRLLAAVGDQPVACDGGPALPVSASLGAGGFPLPGQATPIGWEAAVNLVDMALYTAKGQGRDCVVALQAVPGGDMSAVAQDFERARSAGQVELRCFNRAVAGV